MAAATIIRAAPLEWRPIDTAPKNGTRILVADSDHVSLVAWGQTARRNNWRRGSENGDAYWGTPTHWMPLPGPPK